MRSGYRCRMSANGRHTKAFHRKGSEIPGDHFRRGRQVGKRVFTAPPTECSLVARVDFLGALGDGC